METAVFYIYKVNYNLRISEMQKNSNLFNNFTHCIRVLHFIRRCLIIFLRIFYIISFILTFDYMCNTFAKKIAYIKRKF